MPNICGVDYEFDVRYPFTVTQKEVTVDGLNKVLKQWYNINRNNQVERYLDSDFEIITKGEADKYGNRGALVDRVSKFALPHTSMRYGLKDFLARYISDTSDSYKEAGEYEIVLKEKFHWPRGYFGDANKCWHNSNVSTPRLMEDNGAYWVTVFKDSKPLARAGVLPMENGWYLFNATGIKMSTLSEFFLRDDFVAVNAGDVDNDWFDEDGYYDDPVFYFNGALWISKGQRRDAIWMDESDYQTIYCDACSSYYTDKYHNEHVCGFSHPIGEEYLT
jgi:hypothetical protein